MFYFLSFFDFCISFIFSPFHPVVLASKIWDDFSMDNSDFAVVWKPTTLKRVNQLERKVLELLRYNVSIPASDYAACYFKLRSLVTSLGLKEDEDPKEGFTVRYTEIKGEDGNYKAIVYDRNNNVVAVQTCRSKSGPGGSVNDTIHYGPDYQRCLAKHTIQNDRCG